MLLKGLKISANKLIKDEEQQAQCTDNQPMQLFTAQSFTFNLDFVKSLKRKD
jgi:hypothetical protein